jgi:hypothetical protein
MGCKKPWEKILYENVEQTCFKSMNVEGPKMKKCEETT